MRLDEAPRPRFYWQYAFGGARLLIQSTMYAVSFLFAGKKDLLEPIVKKIAAFHWEADLAKLGRLSFEERLAQAVRAPAFVSSIVAGLFFLQHHKRAALVAEVLRDLDESQVIVGTGIQLLKVENACMLGDQNKAFELALNGLSLSVPRESSAPLVRQLARISRLRQTPEAALPFLTAWLERFPDGPDSGLIWLDLLFNRLRLGGSHLPEARNALKQVKLLLGDRLPLVQKAEMQLAKLSLREMFAPNIES